MRKLFCMTVALVIAGSIDLAKAGENPYIPDPIASSETPDHGRNTYCSIQTVVPFWTCDQELALAGVGEGNKLGLPAREGKHYVLPKNDDCEGPKDGGGLHASIRS